MQLIFSLNFEPWDTISSVFSLDLNDRAQLPVVFPQRPVVFSAPSFYKSPLVSSGFWQRYFELEVAESIKLRQNVARFSSITLLFTSVIATILDLCHRFRHENEATLTEVWSKCHFCNCLLGKWCGDLWILKRCNEYQFMQNSAPSCFSRLAGTLIILVA